MRLMSAHANAAREDAFDVGILHVWVRSSQDAEKVSAAADSLFADAWQSQSEHGKPSITLVVSITDRSIASLF